jgi:hypothetical protein
MYSAVLLIHSWVRWIALIAALGAVVALFMDRTGARAERWGLVLVICMDLQLLLGLTLYFVLSPFTTEALRNFSAAMQQPNLRFFVMDHPATMLVALVLVHVGRVLGRKAATPAARRTRLLVCFGVALLLMLVGMPWPGLAAGRPLFRV